VAVAAFPVADRQDGSYRTARAAADRVSYVNGCGW
jgi:hypothetical protein